MEEERYRPTHDTSGLYATYPVTEACATGFVPWDLALGGVAPGIVTVLGGPRALDFTLATIAADPMSASDTLVIVNGQPPRAVARRARTAGLIEPQAVLSATDPAEIAYWIRLKKRKYVVLDRLETIPADLNSIHELDDACFASGTVFFACGDLESPDVACTDRSAWRCSLQIIRLVSEVPGHGCGDFEVRVVSNPLASSVVSNSVVRVRLTTAGRIELMDSEERYLPTAIELREVSEY